MGAWAIKLLPSIAGLPDRLVILPHGFIIFCELKTNTGQLRPIQEAVHKKLRELGCDVRVIRANNIDKFLEDCEKIIQIGRVEDILLQHPKAKVTEEEEELP